MSAALAGLEGLLDAVSEKNQRYAKLEIARYVRRAWARRLKKQVDVDGKPFKARKKKTESNRKMLQGFAKASRLRTEQTRTGVKIGYSGGEYSRRARIHTLGLPDQLKDKFGDLHVVYYPERGWVGLNDGEMTAIHRIIARYLAKK